MTSDLDTYTTRMLDAQAAAECDDYDRACEATIAATKCAKYTRSVTPRSSEAWQLRQWWATACWIAAQKLGGGYADDYETQETTR